MSWSMSKREILVDKQSRDLQSLGARLSTRERTGVQPEHSPDVSTMIHATCTQQEHYRYKGQGPECPKSVRGQREGYRRNRKGKRSKGNVPGVWHQSQRAGLRP
jgi:hypothetical protein